MSNHFLDHFSELKDPRIERCRKHSLLDMTFREDASRVRRGDAAENLSMLRRLVLNICRRNQTGKSNPSKIRRAGWNDDVRTELLLGAGLPDPPGAGTPD